MGAIIKDGLNKKLTANMLQVPCLFTDTHIESHPLPKGGKHPWFELVETSGKFLRRCSEGTI
jgi:hypothetical protein